MKMNNSLNKSDERYDSSYKREISVTYFGLFCLFVCILMILRINEPFHSVDATMKYTGKVIAALVGLRIFVPIGVVRVAKRQNRNTLIWGITSILFPIISM